MTTPHALVLDFGGVISRTMFETHALSEAALGLPAGTLTWQGPFAPEGDALWRAMQADEISERDYWLTRTREVGHLLGEDWDRMETLVQRARGADVDAVIRTEAVAAIAVDRGAADGTLTRGASSDAALSSAKRASRRLPWSLSSMRASSASTSVPGGTVMVVTLAERQAASRAKKPRAPPSLQPSTAACTARASG